MVKPKYELQTEAEVPGFGTVVCVKAPFDNGLDELKRKGAIQISLRDLAYARVELGEDHPVSEKGSWVKEGVLYVPNFKNRIILTRNSLVANHPVKATDFHRMGSAYFVSNSELGDVIEKVHSSDDSVYVLNDLSPVPTNRFGDDERTVWLFGDMAEKYGDFLSNSKYEIEELPFEFNSFDYIDSHKKPYATLLWLRKLEKLEHGSLIGGYEWDINFSNWIRGVLSSDKNSEKIVKPKLESYTLEQLSNALKEFE